MLLDYLNRQRSQLKEMAETLCAELEKNDGELHETEKFRDLIESENEPPFSEFSPHVVSTRAQERLDDLNQRIEMYNNNRDRIISEQHDVEASLHDIALAIEEAERLENVPETPPVEIIQPPAGSTDGIDRQAVSSVLQQILGIVTTDPFLAQNMIKELISKIS